MTRNNIDILKYTSHLTGKFTVVNDYNFTDISSTKIRNNVFLNKKYLQEDIYHYIIENKLYNAADKILTEHISSS